MAKEALPFDASLYLDSAAARAEYMAAALETGDADFIKEAVGDVIRARGMTAMAKDSGVSRTSLYRAFGEGGNPTLDNVMAVLNALNVRLSAVAADLPPQEVQHKVVKEKAAAKKRPKAKAKAKAKRPKAKKVARNSGSRTAAV